MRDLHNTLTYREALETIVVNNDTEGTGAAIDLQGFMGCELVVAVGQSGDTLSGSVKLDLFIEESDDGSTGWAAVPAADLLMTPAAQPFATVDADGEDGAVYRVGYLGGKRFVRVFVDTTGTHTNGTPIGAMAVLGHGRHKGGAAV